ncbi:MAG: hypothetical protein ACRC30_07915 [Clostridium sp.]
MDVTINEALEKYDKRVNIIGSYFMLAKIVSGRMKYKDIDDDNFYNIVIQTLCFIFKKSLKRKHCLREDIHEFLEELNLRIYKNNYSFDEIEDLTIYLTDCLTNRGKVFTFPFYSVEMEKMLYQGIKVVETDTVKVNGEFRMTYRLTVEGYRLLLATKEYDELYQIHISQTLARLRLSQDDYDGARHEVLDIINNLGIQFQKIEDYIKNIRADVMNLKNQSYVELFSETLETLISQMDKYDELKLEARVKQDDKNKYLNSGEGKVDEKVQALKKSLTALQYLLDEIERAKVVASRLIRRLQDFEVEHTEILEQLLRTPTLNKFSFKEVILDKMESKMIDMQQLEQVFRPMFKCELNNIFNLRVPYKEQAILSENESETPIYLSPDEEAIVKNEENERQIALYENVYYLFFKELFIFAETTHEFTLEELLKNLMVSKRDIYMSITADAFIFRNTLMYFSTLQEDVFLEKIYSNMVNMNFVAGREFQIERMINRIQKEKEVILSGFDGFSVERIKDNILKLNTEIDIETLTATVIEHVNMKFKFY